MVCQKKFSLASDPGEEQHLVNSAAHGGELQRLRVLLEAWMAARRDAYSVDQDVFWEPAS